MMLDATPRRRFLTQFLLPASLLGVAVSACICEEEPPVETGPRIAVDVCNTPRVAIDGKILGGVSECTIDLGDKDIAVRHNVEIRVTNISNIPLVISSVAFTPDSDPAFRVDVSATEIGPGFTNTLVVSVLPLVQSTISGTLLIRSDATNDDNATNQIEIPITLNGVDNGVPDIVVDPLECDFGRVAKGSVASCTLQVQNVGTRDLVFDAVNFIEDAAQIPPESTTPPYAFFGRPPSAGDAIPAGSSANIGIRFTPDVLGSYFHRITVQSNDPDETILEIPLQGIGVDPPTCNIGIKSVNGVPVPPGTSPSVEPLDDVELTAEASTPSTPDGNIASYQWEIVDRPSGSGITFTNATGPTTKFQFSGGVAGIDLAGRYKMRLNVVDDLGTASVNDCAIEFDAIPSDTILAQLSWDTSEGDMDLHMIKIDDQGRFCATGQGSSTPGPTSTTCDNEDFPYDCNFATCKATNNQQPDWDGNADSTDGDPSLDIDDLSGFGPENINIDVAVPGKYLIAVNHFSGPAVVGNTLRIFLFGQLHAEFFREITDGEWWDVAIIHWPGIGNGLPCVEDLSTATEECPDL